jgi:hypothetical protein
VQYLVRRWYAGVFPPLVRTRERLWDELEVASQDLWPIQDRLATVGGQTDGKVHPAFRRARWAIDQGDVELFWRNLYLIREWELRAISVLERHGSDPAADEGPNNIEVPTLEQKARSVLREARDRLDAATYEAVGARLLDVEGKDVDPDLGIDDVLAAIEVIYDRYRHEHSEGVVLRMLEIQVLTFVGAAFATVGGVLVTVALAPGLLSGSLTRPAFLFLVVLFGVLGASVSGLFSLSDVLKGATVPQSVGHFSLTIGRLVVGAAGALVLHVFLLAGVFELVFNLPAEEPTAALALSLAFVGGFSERLLRRAVEQLAGAEDERSGEVDRSTTTDRERSGEPVPA